MEAQDYDALIAACIQHGDASAGGDPQLWAEALEYLSTQPGRGRGGGRAGEGGGLKRSIKGGGSVLGGQVHILNVECIVYIVQVGFVGLTGH